MTAPKIRISSSPEDQASDQSECGVPLLHLDRVCPQSQPSESTAPREHFKCGCSSVSLLHPHSTNSGPHASSPAAVDVNLASVRQELVSFILLCRCGSGWIGWPVSVSTGSGSAEWCFAFYSNQLINSCLRRSLFFSWFFLLSVPASCLKASVSGECVELNPCAFLANSTAAEEEEEWS